jgi:hypothetical protein
VAAAQMWATTTRPKTGSMECSGTSLAAPARESAGEEASPMVRTNSRTSGCRPRRLLGGSRRMSLESSGDVCIRRLWRTRRRGGELRRRRRVSNLHPAREREGKVRTRRPTVGGKVRRALTGSGAEHRRSSLVLWASWWPWKTTTGEERDESGAAACSAVRMERERGAVGASGSFIPRARVDKTRRSGSREASGSERNSGAAAAHHSEHCWKQSSGGGRPKWQEVGVDRRTRTGSGDRLTSRAHSNFIN